MAGLSVLPRTWAVRPEVTQLRLADMDWAPLGERNRRKTLSVDSQTGGLTFYMEIPPNWQGGGVAHYHTCSEEVYVISGDVTLNGREYLEDGAYLYRPSGIVHGHQEGSIGGCRLIIKTDSSLDFNYIPEPISDEEYVFNASDDGRPHILHLKTPELEWSWQGAENRKYGVKLLSEDRNTGASTALIQLPSNWAGEFEMTPDASWEWFVLDGEAVVDDGTILTADSYSLRPAGGEGQAFVAADKRTRLLLWRD
jgi:mannose-6-phosphate isomerase-like protein (cupin superfamily)